MTRRRVANLGLSAQFLICVPAGVLVGAAVFVRNDKYVHFLEAPPELKKGR
jgi:hypothetical protein